MHCQVLLAVVDNIVWEQHEFDDLEPLCVIPPNSFASKKPARTQMCGRTVQNNMLSEALVFH